MEKTVRLLFAIFLCAFARVPLWAQNTLDKAGLTSATPAAVAYSVRQLSSSYAGKALQVRRSSDNTTQDIGFTANGDLDTTALKSFVGSGNGYVTIWYDQSGNGRNATQASTSQQPAIVLSGVVQRANSQPAVVFDGVSQTMASAAVGLINQPFTRNSVFKELKYVQGHVFNSVGGNPNNALYFPNYTSVQMYAGSFGAQSSFSAGNMAVMTEVYNGANSFLDQNGNATNSVNPGSNGMNGIQIASYDGTSYFSNIAVSEVIIAPALINNSDRQNLENNQQNYYINYNPISGNAILNIAIASSAYSVRLLSSNYSGKAIQVRRSSDNTTQDIGFTANGDLDTTALKSFVGSGNGYVTIWYDQSGNGRNAIQATTSKQPAIVLNGTIQRANSQPAVVFNGVSQTMASSTFAISQPFTRNSVFAPLSISGSYPNVFNSVGASPNTALYYSTTSQITSYAGLNGPSQSISASNNPNIFTETFNGSGSSLSKNGNLSSLSNAGTNGINGVQIASNNGSSYFSNCSISEIIIFPQALSSSDRQTLETNQSNYYNPVNNLNSILGIAIASSAYSVRLLSSNYSGKAIQVRRSSDNTTQDIGFTANGDLDTTALKSFVGSGNGYVTIWYDQSGNGRNAIQATTSKQPAIVLNGTIQRANSQPAVVFNGVSQTMASSTFAISQPFTRNSVFAPLSISGSYPNVFNSVGASPNTALYYSTTSQITSYAGLNGPSQSISASNNPNIFTETFNGSGSSLSKNGNLSSLSNAGTNGINGVQIASNNGSSYFSNCSISEIIIFPQALSSSDRQTLETNQSNYYSVAFNSNTIWTGAISNDWSVAGNWSNGIPSASISATIPNVSPLPFPIISNSSITNNLLINSNSQLTINSSLQVSGNLLNTGTITNTNVLSIAGNLSNSNIIGGTIVLNGSSIQSINGAGTYNNFTINNNGNNVVTLNNSIRINNLLTISSGTLNLNNSDITLGSTSISNTAQFGQIGGNIIYPGSGRFVVERIIAKADGSLDSNYYRTLTAPLISDQSIWANWQEGATTANYNPNPGYGTTITGEIGTGQGNDPSTGIDYSGSGRPSLWMWDINAQNYSVVSNTKSNNIYGYKGYTMLVQGDRTYNLFDPNAPSTFTSVTLRSRGKLITGNVVINSSAGTSYQLGGTNIYTDNSYKLSNIADTGYTLIGNPYAASIDFTAAMANSGTTGLVTTQYGYWDGTIKQYVTWDATTGPNYLGSAATKYIQSGQAFFVQNDPTNNPRQFVFAEANKNTNSANLTGVFAQATPMTKLYLSLLNAQGQTRDGALLAQRSDFNNQSIIGEDAHKFRNPTENMAFRTQAQNWSIQKIQQLAVGDTLPVALWNLSLNQPYSFVAAGEQIPAGWAIYDAYTQKVYSVNNGDTLRLSFTPTTDTATYLHRFSVVRTQALPNASAIGLQVQAMNGGYHLLGTAPATLAATGPDYTFERSTDSLHFIPVGQVSNVHDTAFGYVDMPAPAGTLWYRIRALATDRTLYSNTVRVTAGGNGMQIRIYPNPSDGQSIALSTENLPAGLYTIQLYNSNGQRVYANQVSIGNGSSAQALQWNTRLAAGTYYLQLSSVQNPAVQFTQTLIIQNH